MSAAAIHPGGRGAARVAAATLLFAGAGDLVFLNTWVFPQVFEQRREAPVVDVARVTVAPRYTSRQRVEHLPSLALLPGAPPAPGVEPAPSVAPQTEPAPAEPATLPAPQADATTPRLRPLQRVLFARNGHQLGRAELAALSALAAQATAGDTQIVIDGHADQTGPEAFNGWLSERRAMNVADHLVALGIPRDRIRVRHFGSARPAVDGDRPQAMRRNRRVEIALAEGDIP